MPISIGCVVSRIEYSAKDADVIDYHNLGRVVHTEPENDRFWVIPFPEKCENKRKHSSNGERQRYYIKRPWTGSISAYQAEEGKTYRFPRMDIPDIQLLTEDELAANSTAGELRRTRRDLTKWRDARNELFALIEPIVKDATIVQLLDQDWVKERCEKRANELQMKSISKLVRTIRIYVLWGMKKNALLPRFDRVNVRGREKLPRKRDDEPSVRKAGVQRKATKLGRVGEEGVPMEALHRQRLRAGWKRFKVREKYSVAEAFALTLREHFAGTVTEDGLGGLWTPEEARGLPSLSQFKLHGPGRDPELTASRANLAPGTYEKTMRPRVGTSSDEMLAVGFAAMDSTSCDQNLVSVSDPLQLLMSPYDTKVVERYTGYVTGWHCGFEPRSHRTTLMAIANSASDKVEFCARYGIDLDPEDWLSVPISGVKLDNGEGKGAEAIDVFTTAGLSLEFISPYRSDRNGEVETVHRALARAGAHNVIASTEGKRRTRAERNPIDDAAVNFGELMPILIKAILKYNNEDILPPERLTMEMRRDNVSPTRAGIMKWMIANGRVTSAPLELTEIRVRCLPRLKAKIERGLLHLVDPRCTRVNRQRRVPGLRYRFRPEPGQQVPPLTSAASCEVFMDPSYLGKGWLYCGGLIAIELITNDEELRRCSLSEWLSIADEESVRKALDGRDQTLHDSIRLADLLEVCASARARRKAAEAAARAEGTPVSKTQLRANRRENTMEERRRLSQEELGMAAAQPPMAAPPEPPGEVSNESQQPANASSFDDQNVDDAIKAYRANRAAQK